MDDCLGGAYMSSCPKCGGQMNFVQQYSQWYCNKCQQYQQPAQPVVQQQYRPAAGQPQPAYQAQQAVVQENAKRTAQFEAACALIKKDGVRGFKLDIEADSTIAPDEQAEQMFYHAMAQKVIFM